MKFVIEDYNALKRALHEMCAGFAAEDVPEQELFDCKLVADELLSNVLQHGGGKAYFCAAKEGDVIRISVRGAQDFRPPEKSACSGVDAECGRGLFLVDAVCESRDYTDGEGIRVVIRIGGKKIY